MFWMSHKFTIDSPNMTRNRKNNLLKEKMSQKVDTDSSSGNCCVHLTAHTTIDPSKDLIVIPQHLDVLNNKNAINSSGYKFEKNFLPSNLHPSEQFYKLDRGVNNTKTDASFSTSKIQIKRCLSVFDTKNRQLVEYSHRFVRRNKDVDVLSKNLETKQMQQADNNSPNNDFEAPDSQSLFINTIKSEHTRDFEKNAESDPGNAEIESFDFSALESSFKHLLNQENETNKDCLSQQSETEESSNAQENESKTRYFACDEFMPLKIDANAKKMILASILGHKNPDNSLKSMQFKIDSTIDTSLQIEQGLDSEISQTTSERCDITRLTQINSENHFPIDKIRFPRTLTFYFALKGLKDYRAEHNTASCVENYWTDSIDSIKSFKDNRKRQKSSAICKNKTKDRFKDTSQIISSFKQSERYHLNQNRSSGSFLGNDLSEFDHIESSNKSSRCASGSENTVFDFIYQVEEVHDFLSDDHHNVDGINNKTRNWKYTKKSTAYDASIQHSQILCDVFSQKNSSSHDANFITVIPKSKILQSADPNISNGLCRLDSTENSFVKLSKLNTLQKQRNSNHPLNFARNTKNITTDSGSKKSKTKMCKFYLANKCNRGQNCTFSHEYYPSIVKDKSIKKNHDQQNNNISSLNDKISHQNETNRYTVQQRKKFRSPFETQPNGDV